MRMAELGFFYGTLMSGFEREAKRFNPHLTIARLRSPEAARRLASLHQKRDLINCSKRNLTWKK